MYYYYFYCYYKKEGLVQCLDKEGALHEGQAGFRINRSCMDNARRTRVLKNASPRNVV